ncbi:MAG: hypothetical protein AB9869_21935 [Verrucomicrobiia bacterium]
MNAFNKSSTESESAPARSRPPFRSGRGSRGVRGRSIGLAFCCCWCALSALPVSGAVSDRPSPDALAEHFQHARLTPGGDLFNDCRLLVWDVPKSVPAGQDAAVEIGWQYAHGDPGEMTSAAIFGEWQPSTPIFGVLESFRDEPGTVVARRFTFKAPERPGVYRLRWVLVFGGETVPSYHGTPPDPRHPSCLVWAEAMLDVTAPPPVRAPSLPEGSPVDLLLETRPYARLHPGEPPAAGLQFHMLRWDVPKSVRPGQRVNTSSSWRATVGNANACVYVSIIGDWAPEEPLAVHHGYQGEPGWTVTKNCSFTAPKAPGTYRLRWILTQAFRPISVFYGKEHNGAYDPGLGIWAETSFEVAATPASSAAEQPQRAAAGPAVRAEASAR